MTLEITGERTRAFTFLSSLLFRGQPAEDEQSIVSAIANYNDENDFANLRDLASSHHVIMRTFPRLQQALVRAENPWADWVEQAIEAERGRIENALLYLTVICRRLSDAGDVVVIKSLDHWPDFGNDLDLYTNAKVADVAAIMREALHADVAPPSWGDRLANKWNFIVPGLPELAEVHCGRLGQTGEQIAITNSLVARAQRREFGVHALRVPSTEERIVISTLQRMYRHFYLRLCDVVDTGQLMTSGVIDYPYLQSLAEPAGIWEGLCSYLSVVKDYEELRGEQLPPLPSEVMNAAKLAADDVHFRGKFLRIPLFPQAALLYANQWRTLLFHGELRNTLRLTLLPGLGLAAALASKTTGSDKGIW